MLNCSHNFISALSKGLAIGGPIRSEVKVAANLLADPFAQNFYRSNLAVIIALCNAIALDCRGGNRRSITEKGTKNGGKGGSAQQMRSVSSGSCAPLGAPRNFSLAMSA